LKNLRMLVIGLVAGALLASAGSAIGAPAFAKVTALLRPDYVVKVDGKTVPMANVPLTYNGSTYIPLREAGRLLGYGVDFKDGTISLDKKEASAGIDASEELNAQDWVSLEDAQSLGVTAEVGEPDSGTAFNGLTLYGNGNKVELPQFRLDTSSGVAFHSLSNGKTIKIKYAEGKAYLSIRSLRELELIP